MFVPYNLWIYYCNLYVIKFNSICFNFMINYWFACCWLRNYFRNVFSCVISLLESRLTHFLVAFLLDDVKASLSGLTRFVLNRDTNPTNQPINSSGDDKNVATARYESQEVILAESGPMAPKNNNVSINYVSNTFLYIWYFWNLNIKMFR